MATETITRGSLPRVEWPPVITGVFVAIAIQIVLGLFGAAFGFGARPADSSALGIISVIWELLTPLVASFAGAWVAVSIARASEPNRAYLHGILVWCIGLIAGALFLSSSLATGMVRAGAAASGSAPARTLTQPRAAPAVRGRAADEAGKIGAAASGLAGVAAILGACGAIMGAAVARKSVAGEDLWRRGRREYRPTPPVAHADVTGVTASRPPEMTPRPPEEPLHH